MVLARAEALRKQSPALSRALYGVAEGWQAKQVDQDMLRRIGAGTADASTIVNALRRSVKLRENVMAEVQILAGAGGAAQGVAAVLLENEGLAQTILVSHDEAAKLALLACARLNTMPLPVAQVGLLTRGRNPDLRLAAERYLLAEDSPEARALVWALHPGEAFITGWREGNSLVGSDFSAIVKTEEKLRAELLDKEDAPVEIYAMLLNHEHTARVLRVYRDRAVYTVYEDASRYREGVTTNDQVSTFRQFVAANNLLDIGPQFAPCHHDCNVSQFLSLKREGGRRVVSQQGLGGWLNLVMNFDLLGREDAKVHYRLAEEVKGLEVLVADTTLAVKDVWQRGEDLRVLVVREQTEEEAARLQRANEAESEDEDYEQRNMRRRRVEQELMRALTSWRAFGGGKLGGVTTTPELFASSDDASPDFDTEKFSVHTNSRMSQAKAGRDYVLAGSMVTGNMVVRGLWKVSAGRETTRITGEGLYASPLVTPDGLWVVAAKAETDWTRPNDVVRLNLKTGREYRVQIPPAEDFAPVAYVESHGKVLLRRTDDVDYRPGAPPAAAPQFYLLDAATGQTQPVNGVFEPLLQEGGRPLQPTGKPDEFWVAVPDRVKNETRVGRYGTKDFSFRTLFVVPHIIFDSYGMWADEAGAKLYVIYEGQLLRLPLPAAR